MARVGIAALAVALAACGGDFDPASRITENRVLGARVTIEDSEEERAWVRPGETARVRWLVVDRGEPEPLTWAFAWCPAAAARFGPGQCRGELEADAVRLQREPDPADPVFQMPVPEAQALGGADAMRVFGFVCAGGELAGLDEGGVAGGSGASLAEAVECRDGKGTVVTLRARIQRGTRTNRHPELAELRFDGERWPPPPAELRDAPRAGCSERDGVPRVRPDADRMLELTVRPAEGAREPLEEPENGPDRETLQVSHFATAGELEQQFAFVEAEASQTMVAWSPPPASDVPEEGLLARFHFVVRDGRGGTTWAVRALCVQ